jgi:hypothetical protein
MQQLGFLDRGDDGIRLPQVPRKRLLERDASELGRPDRTSSAMISAVVCTSRDVTLAA